ncbi:MAG TPA: hypothetical protein VIB39_22420 [Candidatus Angelobacter sp.]
MLPTLAAALASSAALHAQIMPNAPYDPGTRVMQPRVFAPGVISTDLDESGGALSPDGKDFYFTVLAPYTTAPRFGMICVSHFKDGHWQKPETASFSGQYLDLAPRLSVDGSKLYFTSVRPAPGSKVLRYRIWVTERAGDKWSEPAPLPAPINEDTSHSVDASVSANGDLYFASDRGDPAHHLHIFRSLMVDGKFQGPEKLGSEINSEFTESAPAISPDGKVLVFASNAAPEDAERRRPQDLIAAGKPYPRQDLYVSVNRNGQWTPARHLEHGINSFAEEVYPSFSPDGKFLFWGSERSSFSIPTKALKRAEIEKLWPDLLNGRGNIYFISVDALEAEK